MENKIDYMETANETDTDKLVRQIKHEIDKQYASIVMQMTGKDTLTTEDYKDFKLEQIEDGSYLVMLDGYVTDIITVKSINAGISVSTVEVKTDDL